MLRLVGGWIYSEEKMSQGKYEESLACKIGNERREIVSRRIGDGEAFFMRKLT